MQATLDSAPDRQRYLKLIAFMPFPCDESTEGIILCTKFGYITKNFKHVSLNLGIGIFRPKSFSYVLRGDVISLVLFGYFDDGIHKISR